MKINFTKKEYQTLLEMLYIGDWVLHAHTEEKTAATAQHKELEQKILALASEFGMENFVEFNDKSGERFLSKEFVNESKAMNFIETFENCTFWEELLERLARRDFIKQYGQKAILDMPVSERFEKEMALHQAYDKEFGENGLDNLHVNCNLEKNNIKKMN